VIDIWGQRTTVLWRLGAIALATVPAAVLAPPEIRPTLVGVGVATGLLAAALHVIGAQYVPPDRAWAWIHAGWVAELVTILLVVVLGHAIGTIVPFALLATVVSATRLFPSASDARLPIFAPVAYAAIAVSAAIQGTTDPFAAVASATILLAVATMIVRDHEEAVQGASRAATAEAARAGERTMVVERQRAVLDATRAFLEATDSRALGTAILDALTTLLGPAKAGVSVRDGAGGLRIVAVRGFDPEERVRIEQTNLPSSLVARVLDGHEAWTDDAAETELRSGSEDLGHAASAFLVPIPGDAGVDGAIIAMFEAQRTFDPAVRALVRSLAAQAALSLRDIESRRRLERGERAAERRAAIARELLKVSEDLAALTDPEAVEQRLVDAVCDAAGGVFVTIGQWNRQTQAIEFRRFAGLTERGTAAVLAVRPTLESFGAVREILAGHAVDLSKPIAPELFPPELVEELDLVLVLARPIVIAERVWGFIAAAGGEADELLHDVGPELLTGLAAIAATAIARAEAVARLARHSDVLESSVTERTLQLRQAVAELRVANDAKNDFLGNVSHELRTPLTSILGFSEVLLSGLDGPLTPAQREDLETLVRSSRHLLSLIDDLIDISRIEAGRFALRTASIALGPLIATSVEEVRALAAQKSIAIAVELEGLPTLVVADRQRVHEILLNLLSNAVKFTPNGGSVRVRARGDAANVRIDVSDTGIGIAPADQERVFEKFARVAGPEYEGTGLGLSISRELARLHHGELEVHSTPGLGSVFTLVLPVETPSRSLDLADAPDRS